jgi:transcriptional/translational regulatory protein YebC/TACO1
MINSVISRNKIQEIIQNLLTQIYEFIRMDNKKNEVDELTENLVILYKPDVFKECENKLNVNGYSIEDLIEIIANSKVKDYKSLSNKTIFKFMDMLESTL